VVAPNADIIKVRAVCEIQYPSYGVAVFREVSGGPIIGVHDFSPNPLGNVVCQRCSVHRQQLVTHAPKATCPMDLPSVTVLDRTNLPSPAPSRVQGPQVAKNSKAKDQQQKRQPKPLEPIGKYPCKDRLVGCKKLYYKHPRSCNTHMARHHPDQELDPYPTNSKSSKARTRKPRQHAQKRVRPSEASPPPAAEVAPPSATPAPGKRFRTEARQGWYAEWGSEEESDPATDPEWAPPGSESGLNGPDEAEDSEEEEGSEEEEEEDQEEEEEQEGEEEGDSQEEEGHQEEGKEETGSCEPNAAEVRRGAKRQRRGYCSGVSELFLNLR
jgi:hypothetical protein